MARSLRLALSIMLPISLVLNLAACFPAVHAADLMSGIDSKAVAGKDADEKFIRNIADFSLALFRKTVADKENSLVSPLSALLALAMTANGADGQTLAEMEAVLGKDIPLADLNEYLYTYTKSLPSEEKAKLNIANSIWFQDDESLALQKDFLQRNADYYQAAAYSSPFDQQTVKDINRWVKKNTDGMVDRILESIDADTVMYLINAVAFVAKWEQVYKENDVWEGDFTSANGEVQKAIFMQSDESLYIENEYATGFIKPYANNNYSLVALLPREEIDIASYIAGLSGADFLETVSSAMSASVSASLPKFSYDYSVQLNEALVSMGMPLAFSPQEADFSRMGQPAYGSFYIGDVLHKTFIEVDEQGTKAAAVTRVDMKCTAVIDQKVVRLDRPFAYAIIDNDSNLPLFVGVLMETPK